MEKTMTTLGEVAERIDRMSASCLDHYIPVSEIYFDSLEIVHFKNNVCPMKPIAQKAICNRLGIPYQYLSKCPPDIQALNLNHWIKEERNEELLFRFDKNDGHKRLFRPGQYRQSGRVYHQATGTKGDKVDRFKKQDNL